MNKASDSVRLVLQNSITAEEYDQLVERARWCVCPKCGEEFKRSLGLPGPEAGKTYCSSFCVRFAEIDFAILIKHPSQSVIKIDGWDV